MRASDEPSGTQHPVSTVINALTFPPKSPHSSRHYIISSTNIPVCITEILGVKKQ